jgi:hypothetical protein
MDCNASTAPNADGCECAGNVCCSGGTCPTAHSDGLGGTYYDCIAIGAYSQQLATDACNGHVSSGGTGPCTDFMCGGAGQGGYLVCDNGGVAPCNCWKYTAGNLGNLGKVNTNCACSQTGAAGWD